MTYFGQSQPQRTIPLKCISCGGKLEISPDMNRFACGYCGTEQLVERKGGTVALKGVEEAISRVQVGTDKTAAELALNRLSKELEEVNSARTSKLLVAQAGRKRATVMAIIAFAVAAIIISAATGPDNPTRNQTQPGPFLPGVLGLVALAGAIALKVSLNRKVKESLDADLNKLDNRSSKIHEQIEKHRATVDG